jgi:hypothetical protein
MLVIDKNTKQINLTRGDYAVFEVSANAGDDTLHTFKSGDVIRLKVFKAKDCNCVVLQKDVEVKTESSTVSVELTSEETRFGDVISKPTKYWYEIELNPDGNTQTIIGYDLDGEKIFMLYPEGDTK